MRPDTISMEDTVRDFLGVSSTGVPGRTLIMGVLNVTPDSFSDGGRYMGAETAVRRAEEMAEQGADIIDIGGESSRPGSRRVSVREELDRVLPVLREVVKKVSVPVSVDTCKSEVARRALDAGAVMINDITALEGDPGMGPVIAASGAAVVLMHMKGEPGTMQRDPRYDDVMGEVHEYLSRAVRRAEEAGIEAGRIIVDPGIGFGKTTEHNCAILRDLGRLRTLSKPVLIGTSRKNFIGEITGKEEARRAFGTAATITIAIMNGADIIRVHDIDEMRDVSRVTDAIVRR